MLKSMNIHFNIYLPEQLFSPKDSLVNLTHQRLWIRSFALLALIWDWTLKQTPYFISVFV